jgi:ABC-type transport system involved in cytochrome c biogenesis permease component
MMKGSLNPIIVKELRQARRSRSVIVLIVATVIVCAVMALAAVGRHRHASDLTAGQDLFLMLFVCLSLAGFLVVPFIAHRSLAREQEEGAWDLLQLTGLGPRRIILGKLASTLVLAGVFALLVAPFMLLGFKWNTSLLAMTAPLVVYGTFVTTALSVWALFTAALPATRAQRAATQLVTLASLMIGWGIGFKGAVGLISEGTIVPFHAFNAGRDNDAVVVLIAALVVAGACLVLFEAAVARLSLATTRYARGPRLAVAGCVAGITALGVWRSIATDSEDPLAWAVMGVAILGFAAALGFAADQDRARRRAAAGLALLRPGAVWGLRYVAVLMALPAVVLLSRSLASDGRVACAITGALSYVLIYISAAVLICRGLGFEKLAAPDAVRSVAAALLVFGSVAPPALVEVAHLGDVPWATLPSPIAGVVYLAERSSGSRTWQAGLLLGLAFVLTAFADRLLAQRAARAADADTGAAAKVKAQA